MLTSSTSKGPVATARGSVTLECSSSSRLLLLITPQDESAEPRDVHRRRTSLESENKMSTRSRSKGLASGIIPSPHGEKPRPILFPIYATQALTTSFENLAPDIQHAYRATADNPKYAHFIRIPDRVIRCVDYFGVDCNRASARDRLLSYYLFIGVIDNALDSAQIETGRQVLEYLKTPLPCFDQACVNSEVRLVTETLKSKISEEFYFSILEKLGRLYQRVLRERAARSIGELIRYRKAVGALTADVSYLLIRSSLNREHEGLRRFMKQVGAVGCLIDSLIDLGADRRLGLLRFKPSIADYAQLIRRTLIEGLKVSLAHPALFGLFLPAIVDNLRDRFGRRQHVTSGRTVSDRKDQVARVA